MPIPAKLAVSMETQHLMTDNRERPGKEKKERRKREQVEKERGKKKDTDRERWRAKDGDLVEQQKQFSIGGQREA